MALPNYSPSGKILFGSVPWDNSYAHVRLYSSLSEQQSDIASLMTRTTDNYVYVGRDRRLKVSLCADELYHCNYCMYRNESVTDGWIYCFVSNVTYVNDHTTAVTLETDVFNTYLYGVDWTVPACFIERETVPSESMDYLLTPEPDFPLVYTVDGSTGLTFRTGAVIVQTASQPQENESFIEAFLNPTGYYAESVLPNLYKGLMSGSSLFACRLDTQLPNPKSVSEFLAGLNAAGSVESVTSVFSVPTFVADANNINSSTITQMPPVPQQDVMADVTETFEAPEKGTSIDGYTPRNSKLLCYPYNFVRLMDHQGSVSELRYELMGNNVINIKAPITPTCRAFVYPDDYQGVTGYAAGIVVACGSLGSWCNNQYQTWLAQNAANIALTVVGATVAGVTGAISVAGASSTLGLVSQMVGAAHLDPNAARNAEHQRTAGMASLAGAGYAAGNQLAQVYAASKQPTLTRGDMSVDMQYTSGMQGVWTQRIVCKAEIAQKIDEFFDRWGYAVESIEQPNITSRPSWNYVKSQGCAAKSLNVTAGTTAPFSRGRGTPADALDVIRRAFDSGVTFWHTTANFGNFALSNGVSD